MRISINVAHAAIAPLTTDTSATTAYGTVVALDPMTEASGSPSVNTTTAYGDGVKQGSFDKPGDETVKIGVNSLTLTQEKALFGITVTGDNLATYTEKDVAPYNALFYTIEKSDGSAYYVMYPKVKFKRPEDSVSQSEDSVNFSMPTIEGTVSALAKGHVTKLVKEIDASTYDGSSMPDYLTAFNYSSVS